MTPWIACGPKCVAAAFVNDYLGLGDNETAFRALEQAYTQRPGHYHTSLRHQLSQSRQEMHCNAVSSFLAKPDS